MPMTEKQLVDLHKRIRKQATGMTAAQVEEREEAAERIAFSDGATDEQYETWQEWYGIGFVMQPEAHGISPGMERYDPAKDGRPL